MLSRYRKGLAEGIEKVTGQICRDDCWNSSRKQKNVTFENVTLGGFMGMNGDESPRDCDDHDKKNVTNVTNVTFVVQK